jgi:hypothetical protein
MVDVFGVFGGCRRSNNNWGRKYEEGNQGIIVNINVAARELFHFFGRIVASGAQAVEARAMR